MRWLFLLSFISFGATPSGAQIHGSRNQDTSGYSDQREMPPPPLPASPATRAGNTANTGVGQIGQRQTREQVSPNVEPLGRLNSRIANRVQNRIRNRIDRDYNPQANSNSPFSVAGEQARIAGQRPGH